MVFTRATKAALGQDPHAFEVGDDDARDHGFEDHEAVFAQEDDDDMAEAPLDRRFRRSAPRFFQRF